MPNDDGRECIEVSAAKRAKSRAVVGVKKESDTRHGKTLLHEENREGSCDKYAQRAQRKTETNAKHSMAGVGRVGGTATHSTERSSRSMSLLFISPLVSYSRMIPGG